MVGRRTLRRHEHLHPDQGQHGRRRAGHLRLVAAVHPGAHRAVQPDPGCRRQHRRLGARGSSSTSRPATTRSTWLVYFLLIIGFTYFYVAITFNPVEVADNMKKYGGFIPGIRAGRPTAEYLDYVLTRITLPGSIYLGLIALLPAHRARDGRRQPELPVRRRLDPHHRRCRSRDGQADRRAAAAASLRRAPAMTRSTPRCSSADRRSAGLGQGHAGRAHRRGLRHPGRLDRRRLPRERQGRHRRSASRSRRSSTPATSCPTS